MASTLSLLLTVLVDEQLGVTPLHLAATYSQSEVAEILIAAGADMDAENIVTSSCAFLLLTVLALNVCQSSACLCTSCTLIAHLHS